MIEIKTLAKGFIGYKAAGYADWNPQIILDTATDSGEWSGLYVAPAVEIAKGYLVDSLPGSGPNVGAGTSYLYGVHLIKDQMIICCSDRCLADIGGSEVAKAIHVKGLLLGKFNMKIAGPLIPGLGAKGYFFQGFHDEEGGLEIIIPNALCRSVALMKIETYNYARWEVVSKVSHAQLIEYRGRL